MNDLARTTLAGRGRGWARAAAAATCALLLCGTAQSKDQPQDQPQDLPMGIHRVVAADASNLLRDGDPRVRGEAALVVASRSDPRFHAAIISAANDKDDAARLRALIALGLQATPGTAVVLDQVLADTRTRAQPAGIAAAFGLGLLPPDHAPAVTSRVLTSFLHGNMKRDSDALMALLLGLGCRDPQPQAAALRRLYEDDSTRDADVRAELLHLLLRTPKAFDAEQLRKLLERSSDAERTALLRWLAVDDSGCDAELLPCLERAAAQAGRPEQRAAALAAMTRLHHLPALEIAARAMRSDDPVESGQGVRSVLRIGGASMRRAVERHLLDEKNPVRKAALLANYDAPPSTELMDEAAGLAADPVQPTGVRTAAALLLARGAPERAAPILRHLFRSCETNLDPIAAALMRDGDSPPLERLLDGPTDLRQHPRRWAALLAAEHPLAVRQTLASLQQPGSAGEAALALRLWRATMVLPLPRPVTGEVPVALRELLGD